MTYEHTISKFLVKDKEKMNFDEFSNKFYRNITLYNKAYKEGQFDEFLSKLYMKSSSVYEDWYKALNKIAFSFVRKNLELITVLVKSNNIDAVITAYDMQKKKGSLISRSISRKTTASSVIESKIQLLTELNMQLALIESEEEENIVRKAQAEFYLCYGEYENDKYLGTIYNEMIASFKDEIRNAIITEINKIDGISADIRDKMAITMSCDDIYHNRRTHRTPNIFKQIHK